MISFTRMVAESLIMVSKQRMQKIIGIQKLGIFQKTPERKKSRCSRDIEIQIGDDV
jgi:hypothetical protein